MEVSAGGVSASAQGAGNGSDTAPHVTDPQTTTSANKAPPAQAAKSAPETNDDPEWDFGEGKKLPRSKALERIKNFEKGAYRAMQDAAEASKSVKELRATLAGFGVSLDEFKQDPAGALKKAAHQHVAREVDESLMDPKEREAQKRARDLEEREARIKDKEEKHAKEESEARAAARAEEIAESFAPALKEAGLPANAKTVARMAKILGDAYRQKVRLDPAEVAQYVAAEIRQEQDWDLDQATDANALIDRIGPKRLEMILDLPPDVLMAKLGPKRLEMLREAMLAQHLQAKPPPIQRPTVTNPVSPARKYIGWEDYSKLRKG